MSGEMNSPMNPVMTAQCRSRAKADYSPINLSYFTLLFLKPLIHSAVTSSLSSPVSVSSATLVAERRRLDFFALFLHFVDQFFLVQDNLYTVHPCSALFFVFFCFFVFFFGHCLTLKEFHVRSSPTDSPQPSWIDRLSKPEFRTSLSYRDHSSRQSMWMGSWPYLDIAQWLSWIPMAGIIRQSTDSIIK